ncbi:aryl-alcohol dehydrogenase AAD14 [Colletotrichum paranaense]|nr:aryl-alcohol dehydrogenase AAD14 [Colletotrichum costaricense]XP_060347168.1 aryl-alcohol dehydrogenase AAD14 [Colletotrichum paranaense]XP_060392345.1 aryl-alcohol dehydrogenase AAD14 [Colletotrichum abscissum]KAK1446416.1 aryl-alcohol dehydrogenase AAD14 [Colletotrichum melonis]KAK1493767.1 aryl-alcohol dehydrogenase AAD14 [Colletotrichum cuscutae]KAK1717701.1 putative aryl-alcohol dehydrogenase [Colletotrichum lupini]KAI3541354.1 aryl-alcohol dehydrogenase AAD14 [Colletotrichum abscissu
MATESARTLFFPAPDPPTPLARYRILSPNAAIRVSPLQMGTMSLGTAWSDGMGPVEKNAAFSLLDAYLDAGGNFFDCSNGYQHEQSESWLGEWMEVRGVRDRCVVATKFSADYRMHALGKGRCPNAGGNSRASMHMSLRDSLAKLRTDWIDVFYVQWWDYTASIEEVMDALHNLVQQGKVHYLGIANCPAWVVSAANTYARAHGKTSFSIYQGYYSVIMRDMERDIIPMARQFGMAIAPYGAAGMGKFKTRDMIEARRRSGDGQAAFRHLADQTETEMRVSKALAEVAEEVGVTSITAVALAYVMAKVPYVFPVVGGRKVEQMLDNIDALTIQLSEAQIAYLESVEKWEPGWPYDVMGWDPHVSGTPAPIIAASAKMDFVRRPKAIGYD